VGALAVAHDPTSAAVVRHAIAADLGGQRVVPDCIDDVVLVASELVANAVVHAPTPLVEDGLTITWEVEPDSVVVQVIDESPELPYRRTADDTDARGRGLFIVAALALDWGVRRTRHGKQVWARVPIVRQ
jgi:anti-sigma regulatory factor (Ser/Thr protein kinase)